MLNSNKYDDFIAYSEKEKKKEERKKMNMH